MPSGSSASALFWKQSVGGHCFLHCYVFLFAVSNNQNILFYVVVMMCIALLLKSVRIQGFELPCFKRQSGTFKSGCFSKSLSFCHLSYGYCPFSTLTPLQSSKMNCDCFSSTLIRILQWRPCGDPVVVVIAMNKTQIFVCYPQLHKACGSERKRERTKMQRHWLLR